MKEIWDIGHSTSPWNLFLHLLLAHKIECLVDIRRFPTSKKSPHFRRKELEAALCRQGIAYVWMGISLGGFRPGGYESWMKGDEFSRGLKELEALAQAKRVAVMCAEKYFGRCHRRFLLELLAQRGWKVHHITYPSSSSSSVSSVGSSSSSALLSPSSSSLSLPLFPPHPSVPSFSSPLFSSLILLFVFISFSSFHLSPTYSLPSSFPKLSRLYSSSTKAFFSTPYPLINFFSFYSSFNLLSAFFPMASNTTSCFKTYFPRIMPFVFPEIAPNLPLPNPYLIDQKNSRISFLLAGQRIFRESFLEAISNGREPKNIFGEVSNGPVHQS